MRVISGEARGRRLKVPPEAKITRPMAAKVKEALFSVLASLGVEYERVLDLYAGSGGIGIEALSRGADWCDFVDRDATACRTIRENLEHVGFSERGRAHQSAVLPFARAASEPYDMLIMDPPYADPEIVPTLEAVSHTPAVRDGTIIVIGHSPRVALADRIGRLVKLRTRCHGDSCFSIFDVVFAEVDGSDTSSAAAG
jgi:16S rRNA (guanine966-N2)-methyltransferase